MNIAPVASFSRYVAAEIRAEMARKGISQRQLAIRTEGISQTWLSRHIGIHADSELTLEDIAKIAEALGVTAERFGVVLPRLDSNQQPSGYQHPQVTRRALELVA